jgi:hypothetical protein
MKPGYKTTEFWLTTAASVLGAVTASGVIPSDSPFAQIVGLIVSLLATMGYQYQRGVEKTTASKTAAIISAAGSQPANPTQK